MGKIGQMIQGIRSFWMETQVELKKCAWPTKPELVESTIMVIAATILLGAFVGFSDLALVKLLNAVIR